MPAPEVSEETAFFTPSVYGGEVSAYIGRNGSYTLITGALPESFFSGDDASVYLTINGTTYEAFRASEYSDCGNGFSVYIPADTELDSIEIFTQCSDGRAVSVEVPADKLIRKEQ